VRHGASGAEGEARAREGAEGKVALGTLAGTPKNKVLLHLRLCKVARVPIFSLCTLAFSLAPLPTAVRRAGADDRGGAAGSRLKSNLMTDPGSLVPISDEQAKAAQEAFKAFQEAVKALHGAGQFLRQTFGTVPEDVVALLGGNWLKVRRAEQLVRMLEKVQERLHARRVEPIEPSLSIALPIFVAAADESRDELQDIWARLLAAAADPARANSFRIAFIETVKKMDPLDAAVLQAARPFHGQIGGKLNELAAQLGVSRDEVDVSLANLVKLDLAHKVGGGEALTSPFGREFLRAVVD
jgi:hypothetical protein